MIWYEKYNRQMKNLYKGNETTHTVLRIRGTKWLINLGEEKWG